jgi:hypothetical protein
LAVTLKVLCSLKLDLINANQPRRSIHVIIFFIGRFRTLWEEAVKKLFTSGTILILVVLVLIQFIPINRTNPPVTREVRWDSQETRDLAKRACFDCHSNESDWPWYSHIAPVSFWLANHIFEGRNRLNFSEWDKPNAKLEDVEETVKEGNMPPWYYTPIHAGARLTQDETNRLLAGLQATFQQDPPIPGDREGGEGGEGR